MTRKTCTGLVVVLTTCIGLLNQINAVAQKTSLPAIASQSSNRNSHTTDRSSLPYSTPEAEGISTSGILKFLDDVEQGKNELHSYVIVRHGKIVSEGWWHPYSKDLKHVMFSVSKSFTSMAVGLAIDEKKLRLTDTVMSFFPQSYPDTLSPYMRQMTIEDLLKMAVGMNTDPISKARSSTNWPNAFLFSSVENKPGTVFKYNNMATFMLSVIIQNVTGQKLVDYLRPRLFDPLGFQNITWDETPEGYSFGAIGLRLLSEDMAKFGQMLLQKGNWQGRQVIPQSWVEQATSFKIASNDPGNKTPHERNDWEQGYGYQFWMCTNNGFRADGAGGQFIIVLPEKDAVIVLTCSAKSTQEELDLVWRDLLPAIQDNPLPQDKKISAQLASRLRSLSVPKPLAAAQPAPSLLSAISGKRIDLEKNEIGLASLKFSFANGAARITLARDSATYDISAGEKDWVMGTTNLFTLSAAPRPKQLVPVRAASRYTWIDGSNLEWVTKFPEESIGTETWALHFEESGADVRVRIEIKGTRPRFLEGKIAN